MILLRSVLRREVPNMRTAVQHWMAPTWRLEHTDIDLKTGGHHFRIFSSMVVVVVLDVVDVVLWQWGVVVVFVLVVVFV